MKHFTLKLGVLACMILFSLSLTAQNESPRKMALGFIAAPTINWMSTRDENIENAGAVAGFKFGLNGDYYFSPNYAFSTGLFLNKTGGKLKYLGDSSRVNLGGEEVVLVNEGLNEGANE